MPINIAFYVHHHGSGHLMRCLAISTLLTDCQITFLGSRLAAYSSLIPDSINCIELPMDTPSSADRHYAEGNPVEGLHYAPLNVEGQRQRTALLTEFFNRVSPLLFVVDVSVEVALLARLSGVPTIVIKQHGNRQDLPHQLAYQSAEVVLAPFSPMMKQEETPWLANKLVYTGGFSRYPLQVNSRSGEQANRAAVLVGAGGTSLDATFLIHIARQAPDWIFEVVGKLAGSTTDCVPTNVIWHGQLDDPRLILERCVLVIGNAGHNTVMEMAALNKRFIVIPEQRPFEEQLIKATILDQLALAYVVHPHELYQTNWPAVLTATAAREPHWQGIVDEEATARAAQLIRQTYGSIYNSGDYSLSADSNSAVEGSRSN
ncbi:hypothetical protein M0L20_01780 [Spirosoma sp. RP8]|uniref:Glycosyl transferase family 28 C-terminal domain-containing protein n=1 Tax=Spirosoma liriopis TaxID=2937440 RepID=A0ABT0HEH8_9BACT|nr:glycosyltransferase [Spirosoma liriopis]MCK8490560.1 hypothetical protein [Spirosoma liriopis]